MPDSTRGPVTNAVVLSTIEWLGIVQKVQEENKKFRNDNHSLFKNEKPGTKKLTQRMVRPPLREEKRQEPSSCEDLQRIVAAQQRAAKERKRRERRSEKGPTPSTGASHCDNKDSAEDSAGQQAPPPTEGTELVANEAEAADFVPPVNNEPLEVDADTGERPCKRNRPN